MNMLNHELVGSLTPDLEREQYFFDESTLGVLGRLASNSTTICACAPRLGAYLVDSGLPVTIIDSDPRVRTLLPDFVQQGDITKPHDLDPSLRRSALTLFMDPPFDLRPQAISEALDYLLNEEGRALIVFPRQAGQQLLKHLESNGFIGVERKDIPIGYENPPRIAQLGGVGLFELVRS